MTDPNKKSLRVGLISLGCAKNLVDAEIMLGALMSTGVEITNAAEEADAVIVNTCSFIDAAQEESVDTILESDAVREANNRGQAIIVSGCLPQRFRQELPALLPEVDAFMGVDQVAEVSTIVDEAIRRRTEKLQTKPPRPRNRKRIKDELGQANSARAEPSLPPTTDLTGAGRRNQTKTIVSPQKAPMELPLVEVHQRPTFIPDFATPRFRLTPPHFAYVKIAEGCNHPCSFCIIPRMRGAHRSRQQADIVQEAKELIAQGVKELNLISQDSTYYGLDLRSARTGSIAAPDKFSAAARALPKDSTTLCSLLRDLNQLEGEFWIRLLYTHPAHWTDELIATIADCSKVARYVDMPLQHIHPSMLERMRRETSKDYIVDLIERIRAGIPGIAIRTTFIVGFPGETDAYFDDLLEFIRDTRFERLGIFTYSQEDGTRASKMGGQIPNPVKLERQERAMAEQMKISNELGRAVEGETVKVLVEGKATARQLMKAEINSWEHGLIRNQEASPKALAKGSFFIARGESDAPDIDGRIYLKGSAPVGEFANARILAHTAYDLIGEVAAA